MRRRCRHYAHPVARRHTFLVHAPQHMLSHISCGSSVTKKVSVFGSFCVMSLLSLPHSPRHIPTSLSSRPAPTSQPSASSTSAARAGVNPQAHPLAGGVWPTGRLVSTHKNDERPLSTRKLVANTQIIITCRRYSTFLQKKRRRSPIDATFSVESYKTNVLTSRLLWHRR